MPCSQVCCVSRESGKYNSVYMYLTCQLRNTITISILAFFALGSGTLHAQSNGASPTTKLSKDTLLAGQPGCSPEVMVRAICALVTTPPPRYILNGGIYAENEIYYLNPKKVLSVKYIEPSPENVKIYGSIPYGAIIISTQKRPFLKRKKATSRRTLEILFAQARTDAQKTH